MYYYSGNRLEAPDGMMDSPHSRQLLMGAMPHPAFGPMHGLGNYAPPAPQPLGLVQAAPAAAAGVVITAEAVLAAIAFVLSAMAAAYLLIRAYEAAKSSGFGVSLAVRALSAGLGRLVAAGRRMAQGLRYILDRVRRLINPNPRCRELIAALVAILARIEATLAQLGAEATSPVPRIPELRLLMRSLTTLMDRAKGVVTELIRECPRFMTP